MLPSRSWAAGGCGAISFFLALLFLGNASNVAYAQKSKSKARKRPTPTPSAAASATPGDLTNIPLPVGHEARGLVLPDFDLEGHLRGKFVAASARRTDQEHIDFGDLKITTFKDDSQTDLEVTLRTATFNLKTKILSSKESGTVQRTDFNIVGDSLDFDTEKRTGHMKGHVKMVIKNNSSLVEKASP